MTERLFKDVKVWWPCPKAGCHGEMILKAYGWKTASGPQMHLCNLCGHEERPRDEYSYPGTMRIEHLSHMRIK